jgi:hypothetical protein
MTCMSETCQNPCLITNPCSRSQQCLVTDTQTSIRSVACLCPEGTLAGYGGTCEIVNAKPQCESDYDCNFDQKCAQGTCVSACSLVSCGLNALCLPKNHRGICECIPGYFGNPSIACNKEPVTLPPIVSGCLSNNDCPDYTACQSRKCINPCAAPDVCAPNANCRVRRHQAVCTCPDGYIGSPQISCSLPIKPECTTDAECPDHLACIREKCQNPCFTTTCGVNAECRVTRHRAICYCKQGYEGDPYRICEERKQQYHLVLHVESDFIRILLTLYFSWMQKR